MQDNKVVAALLRCVVIKDIMQNNLANFAHKYQKVKFCPTVYRVWLLTSVKSQILVNVLLASEAAFWMHNTIALIILCSATNIAFALSKWVRDQVVELFQDRASVVRVTI